MTGAELSGTLGRVWAPAVDTFLTMSWGAAGWLADARASTPDAEDAVATAPPSLIDTDEPVTRLR